LRDAALDMVPDVGADVVSGDGGAVLLAGLGGDAGYGVGSLPPCDDCTSPPVDITPVFPMGLNFGSISTVLYVNTNGNVTLTTLGHLYTPVPFPAFGLAMIAPWWADADTSAGGAPT